jgi:hypothetical protein
MIKWFYEDRVDQRYPFQVYVNSFFAFLNARYYMQPNIDTAEFLRDGVYRPELRIRGFEDDKLQASKASTDMFKRTYKDQHPTCPSQAVTVCCFVVN